VTRGGAWLLLALVMLAPAAAHGQKVEEPGQAEAQERESNAPAQSPQPLDSVTQTPLFADMDWRRRLADEGVALTTRFYWEPAINERGYKGSGFDSAQELDFGVVLDLKKLRWSEEGTVRILFSWRSGDAIQNDFTGAYIQNQAFWGQGQNFRLDEISYERTFLDRRLDVKGGFYSLGNDFGGLSYVCNFNNNGNCGHPLGLLYGSSWLDSPTGAWGGRLKWTDPSGWYIEAGTYDVTPVRKQPKGGFILGFDHTTGLIAPVEIGYVRGKTPADYPGTFKVGFYYDSSRTPDMANPGHLVAQRTGGYVQAAQQIWKLRPGRVQGLSIFGVATLSDPQTGLFRTTYEAGASLRGAFGRDNDVISVGWVGLNVNDRIRELQRSEGKAVQSEEQLVEVNYGWQAAPWILIRPAFQYVIRPGALATRPDTAVFAAHVLATF
jgi:porin